MTVNRENFYDWSKGRRADKIRYRKASPNMEACKDFLIKRFGGVSVGIFSRRFKRGSKTVLSTHYFGAALDWRYPNRKAGEAACKLLVANSKEWGIQMIVDYVESCIWTPSKGWRKMAPNKDTGVGQTWASWLHIETTKTSWDESTSFADRLKKDIPAQKS